jgi:isoamylase/glycogen operon protein
LELDEAELAYIERQRQLENALARHEHGNVPRSLSRRVLDYMVQNIDEIELEASLSAREPELAEISAAFGGQRVGVLPERRIGGLQVRRGHPLPYGVSLTPEGTNFSIFADEEEHVALILYPTRRPERARRALEEAQTPSFGSLAAGSQTGTVQPEPTAAARPPDATPKKMETVSREAAIRQTGTGAFSSSAESSVPAPHPAVRSIRATLPIREGSTDDEDRFDDVHSTADSTGGNTPRAMSLGPDDEDREDARNDIPPDGLPNLNDQRTEVSRLQDSFQVPVDWFVSIPTIDETKSVVIELDPVLHRTGNVWHVQIAPNVEHYGYAWRIGDHPTRWGSNLVLDPYAKCIFSPISAHFNRHAGPYRPICGVPGIGELAFDWDGVLPPRYPFKDLIIYELHIRGLTKRVQSPYAGTFLGVIEKIPYLKQLGINAVEIMPCAEFNETEWDVRNPRTGEQLCQFWGYSPICFFAPMNRFSMQGFVSAAREFKTMVRELHRQGIEVILDVVFNHTGEFGDDGPPPLFYHFKGLALSTYYILDKKNQFANYSGCGNSLSANHAVTAEFIHECIRYWALEMGVDGFRFDLAAVMCRDPQGQPMASPPVIERLSKDPCLRHLKLIAEPWDLGQYLVGHFPHYGCWAEWNGRFRDTVRRFIKGDPHLVGDFATRLCGSEDLYANGRRPWHSINFVTAHDGFTLYDLVSYSEKHNWDNGEENQDGESHNNSWNCGFEGDGTRDAQILYLRQKQMRNFLVALLLSTGTPMVLMGDEYGHTRRGNNNAWCQDNELNYFDWDAVERDERGLVRFSRLLILFRRANSFLCRQNFVTRHDVSWIHADWSSAYNFLVMRIIDPENDDDILVGFNAGPERRTVTVPALPSGRQWLRIVDTNLASPADFYDGETPTKIFGTYVMQPWSSIILQSRRRGASTQRLEELVLGRAHHSGTK